MKDENKSREQLIGELNELRQRVSEFDTLEDKYKRSYKALQKSKDELENRIEEQKKEREEIDRRLRIIVESAQSITACSRIDEIGKFLLEEFSRTMGAEGGSLYRVKNKTLVLDYCLDPGHASDVIPLPPKRGSVLDRVLKEKKPILIKDIGKEKNTLKSGWDGYKDGSLIVFPVPDEEGNVAVIIALHNKTFPPFVEQDKEIGLMLVSYSYEALRTIRNTQALRESEKLLNSILSASSVGIAYARERTVIWANEAMERMFGFQDEKEYLGQTTYQLYASEEEYQRVGKIVYDEIKTGGNLIETDALLKRKDGSIFDGRIRVSAMDPSNPMRGIIVSIIDITERKKAEKLLKESEEKFRNLFENSIEAVFTVDLKGNFTSINRAVEIISGYTRDELIGKNSFNYMKPEFREDVYQKYNHLFRTGEPIEDLTYVFFDKKGRERTLEGYVNIIRKEDKIIGFQGTLRDITEKKASEEKLRESEERYRELIENIEDIVYILDGKGNVVFFNKAAEKSIGYSRDELLKMNYKDFITAESYKYAEEIFKRRLSGENVGIVEHQFKNKKGEIVTIETRERLVWEGDRVVEVHGIGRDITERKKAEEALKKSEEKYRMVVENAKEAILVLQDGVIKFFNPRAIEITGFSEKELLSKPFLDLLHPDDLQMAAKRHQRVLDGKDLLEPSIYRIFKKDGSLVWIEGTGVSIQWDGNPASLGFFSDVTEEKKAEDALRESEERYRKLVETSNDGIVVIQDGKIVFINRIFTEISEYAKEEILNEPFDKFIYPDDLNIVVDSYLKRISGEKAPQTYEFRLVDKGGQPIPVEINAVFIDWYGKPATLSFLRDIRDRKQAEEKIHEINERMEATLNALPDILFEVDRHGRIYDFRAQNPELLYTTPQEFLGKTVNEILPEEASNVIMDAIGKGAEKGRYTGAIYTLETPLGPGLFELSIATKGDPKTEDGRLICLVRDITERKIAEEALRKSEEKFRILIEKVPVGILYLDNEGNVIYENPTSRTISGGEVDLSKNSTVVGMNIFDLQGIMNISGLKEITQKLLNGETVLNFTGPIETTEGKKLYIQASATPLYDLEGNQSGAIVIYSDVTEKKRLEDQLIQSQKMEAVGTLAGGIAHNFNNILVGIMGYSEFLLKNKGENDLDYKALKTIHEGTIRASFLTRELLNVARRGEYRPVKISLNHVVGKTLPLIRGTFDKSIDIETHLEEDLMLIKGDSGQLEQSLLNICINARDAMTKGGTIIVETYNQKIDSKLSKKYIDLREGDYVVLSVTDNGIGMSDEVKERIFEPFFTTKEDKGGTGMGLSTVYGIVKNHDGLITVYSEEGKGSTFKLYFPAIKGTLKEIPAIENEKNYTGSATILLVDDEKAVLEMWGDFLLKQGHQVLTAQDGKKALKIFKEKKNDIDLVILDYVMPLMGAKETLIELKEIDPNVKVLVTSGYSENGPIREIISKGADGFIQKPAQLNELHRKIIKILNHTK